MDRIAQFAAYIIPQRKSFSKCFHKFFIKNEKTPKAEQFPPLCFQHPCLCFISAYNWFILTLNNKFVEYILNIFPASASLHSSIWYFIFPQRNLSVYLFSLIQKCAIFMLSVWSSHLRPDIPYVLSLAQIIKRRNISLKQISSGQPKNKGHSK